MPVTPEQQPVAKSVMEIPTSPKVPESLKNELQAIETNQQAKVQINPQGQPVITQSPGQNQTQNVKIQIPGDTATLASQAKGSITNALTWLAKFLLRLLAKQQVKNVGED